MKVDMNIVREMVLCAAEESKGESLRNLDYATKAYHKYILAQYQLMVVKGQYEAMGEDYPIMHFGGLSERGLEFVRYSADDKRWQRVYSHISEKVGEAPINVWMSLLEKAFLEDLGAS